MLAHSRLDLIDDMARERNGTSPGGRDCVEQMGRVGIALDDKIHLEFSILDIEQLGANSGLTPTPVVVWSHPVRLL